VADKIKAVLEGTGIPSERGVYTGKGKPAAYCTFIRMIKAPIINADDKESSEREMYRITLFCKGNFEEILEKILETLRDADFYVNEVDTEQYEPDTGYWMVPITIEILKE